MDSNLKSPDEIANGFASKGQENQLEVKEEVGGSTKDTTIETKTQAVGGKVAGELTESVEAVVIADPAHPPLSLFFLAKLLRNSYGPCRVNLEPFWHSSCEDRFYTFAQILNQPAEKSSSAGNIIDVSIIWKKVPDGKAQLLVQSKLERGEANLARYFSSLLPPGHPLNYDFLQRDHVIRVDELLDKVMDGLDLGQLEKQLEANNPCLIGEASIADFVTWSVVFPYGGANPIELKKYSKVFKWLTGYTMWPGMNPVMQQSQIRGSAK